MLGDIFELSMFVLYEEKPSLLCDENKYMIYILGLMRPLADNQKEIWVVMQETFMYS